MSSALDIGSGIRLGLMYFEGEGFAQDYTKAVKWYRKAAEQDLAPAQYSLGFMYAMGYGLPQDTEANETYFLAALKGGSD